MRLVPSWLLSLLFGPPKPPDLAPRIRKAIAKVGGTSSPQSVAMDLKEDLGAVATEFGRLEIAGELRRSSRQPRAQDGDPDIPAAYVRFELVSRAASA